MKSVTRLHRSSAIQAYRELLVWDSHPLVILAVRAHVVFQFGARSMWPPAAFTLYARTIICVSRPDRAPRS